MSAKTKTSWTNAAALALVAVAAVLLFVKNYQGPEQLRLLNVSYDPTREVYQEIDRSFVESFQKSTGSRISVEQSHGGSSKQARAVIDGGLAAYVVTLALPDADAAKHHSERAARAYLAYLFSDEAQEIFASEGYRPSNAAILRKYRKRLPHVVTFPVTLVAKDWDDAQEKYFGDNGVFNAIRLAKNG
jgi:ABC-type sulfate transport system substrate-binding protein